MKTLAISIGILILGYILYEYNARTCHWEDYVCWQKTPDTVLVPEYRPLFYSTGV